MMESGAVRYEHRGGAAWLTLASPQTRNALTPQIVEGLADGVDRALNDPAVRCLVITGEGSAFCAGANLKSDGQVPRASITDVFARLWFSPKPVITGVNGAAYGGGLGLVAVADIALAARSARFAFSEVRVGVIPAVISVFTTPKIGAGRATRLYVTGEAFDSTSAAEFGLVHAVIDDSELVAAIEREIEIIAKGAPGAIAAAKGLTRGTTPAALAATLAAAEAQSRAVFAGGEAREGMLAFREKRAPDWTAGG